MYSIAFNLADGQENNVYFKDIEVKVKQNDSWTDIISLSELLYGSGSCFYTNVYPAIEPSLATVTDGEIVIEAPAKVYDAWETRFFIRLPQTLPAGTQYTISFDYKASANATVETMGFNEPGQYVHHIAIGDVNFNTSWQNFKGVPIVSDDYDGSDYGGYNKDFRTIAFYLSQASPVTYYIKNIKVEIPSDAVTVDAGSVLMDMAQALAADDEAVAVGKLREAIQWAQDNNDSSQLMAAIDQFKADNADLEKDETAKVATSGWKDFNGNAAGVCLTQYAPAITTYDGRTAQLAEVYEGSTTGVNRTGTIIYQDITGLTNGKYKVGFYGNAFFTSGRGFDSPMYDGADDVAYVFANEEQAFITARIATSTTQNDFRQFDVEVTDGNIRLGMGKAKVGTNWHTMQIYQLTWFTTAKEAYAADQAELAALVAEATYMSEDFTKTNGRDEFMAILETASSALNSNWYNVPELDAIIASLKTAIADFRKANYYIDFAAGEYYIIDAAEGVMMSAGHDWGTQGIVEEIGLDLTLMPNNITRGVTIDSRIDNGSNQHYLGKNLYMDSDEYEWFLDYQGFGFYILNSEGQFINFDDAGNLMMSDTPREWIIVGTEGVRDQFLYEMESATSNNPMDATFFIRAHNFNRNDTRNAEAWAVSGDCTNYNLCGGNNVNNCAESYHSTFTISQVLADVPAGIYQLTAQGFYRQEDNVVEDAPVFFIGSATAELPAIAGSENSMWDASNSFGAGLYTIAPVEFYYDGEGSLIVGVKGTAEHQWVIFDNFQLTYFGKPASVEGRLDVCGETVTNENAADILGNGVFSYDAQTKTLHIKDSYEHNADFLIHNWDVEGLTIAVDKDVTLTLPNNPDFAMWLWANTTITGLGKLTLYGNISIINGNVLTIDNADLELQLCTSKAIMGNFGGEKLIVKNSNIHAKSYYLAISDFTGGITLESCAIADGCVISEDGASIVNALGNEATEVTINKIDDDAIKDVIGTQKDSYFTLDGRKLQSAPSQPGIYIKAGKKVLVK